MASYDPDANITMNTSQTEDEWYRVGLAAQQRLKALQQSMIVIPEALKDLVRVRQSGDEVAVVRLVRGGSPKALETVH